MGLLKEFKEFALRGNVVDMAIGIVIGGAFGKVVTSMVGDLIMPIVGRLTANQSFSQLYFPLNGQSYSSLQAAKDAGAPVFGYGAFIQTIIDFVIIAFAIFLVVKLMNRFIRKAGEATPAAPPEDVVLLREIRDALVQRG
jgi:large conductance mechanosensitive channel